MRLFKNKFFIIALIIAVVLVIITSIFSIMGLSFYIRNAIGVITSPFQRAAVWVSDGINGFTAYFTEYNRLAKENEELKEQLKKSKDEIYSAALIEEENEWLRKYLSLKREHMDYELEDASIISREAGNYMTVFVLNRGSLHGVETNMPIITEDGVVGYIAETGLTWSKGITLAETASSVGAYVERSNEIGVISGSYALKENGECIMSYLPKDADIKAGDRILTSGIGSIYPQGLVIGEVTEVVHDEYTREIKATVKLSASFQNLKKVMIIKSFNITNK